MDHIFSGIKILDFTKAFSGPFATRNFADYGATVIKVENSEFPDATRNFPPLKNGASGYFEILNRNKKSITLNLKSAIDLEKFYKLTKDADVFVENASPHVKHDLKIDYETLRKINPQIIYASLSGVGQNNERRYYDVIAQAESGLMSLTGYEKEPVKISPAVVDAFSGMSLAFAIASALFYREKTNLGQYIDTSMIGCAMNLIEANLIDYSITNQVPKRAGNSDLAIAPFGVYRTKDGYLALATGSESLWCILQEFLLQHVTFDKTLFDSNQKRLVYNNELTNIIEQSFSQLTTEEVFQQMEQLGIPCGKVKTMKEVSENIELFNNQNLVKNTHPKLGICVVPGFATKFSAQKPVSLTISPSLGENNDEFGI